MLRLKIQKDKETNLHENDRIIMLLLKRKTLANKAYFIEKYHNNIGYIWCLLWHNTTGICKVR